MFRLTALLCGGIYLAMLLGGQDRGQLRFGLMAQPEPQPMAQVVQAPATETAAPVVAASFVPETPVMVQPAVVATPVAPAVAAPEPASLGEVMRVAGPRVNVREGPGKDHAVVGRLTKGEEVTVLVRGEGEDGWSLIRIEGDGIEGYVATRLLSE